MAMGRQQKNYRKRRIPWVLGMFVLVSFVVLFLLQASNLWKDFRVETAGDTLLLYALSSLNFFAFVIFGFIFLRSILKLARERKALQLGSRIKTRLLVYFAAISLLPIIAMAGFSFLFMNRAIERWFSQIPENVLHETRNKVEAGEANDVRDMARLLAEAIGTRDMNEDQLDALAEAGGLEYIEIVAEGKTMASTSDAAGRGVSDELATVIEQMRAAASAEEQVAGAKPYAIAQARMDGGRKLIIVPAERPGEEIGKAVEGALVELDRLKGEQIVVRQLGFLTLGVLTFLLIFASMWTAFYVARGLTVPIRALAEGADEIARGNLAHRVETEAEDELELLVSSFNEMAARLAANSDEIIEGRRYTETVLQTLPTGVISLGADDRVSTINRAARRMLFLEDGDFAGVDLEKLVSAENFLVLERIVRRSRRIGYASEQTEIRREAGEGSESANSAIPVAFTAAILDEQGGVVLVMEDLSELIAAQRASAWQEVARRMAHEIKNPLTPIQLSAERIAKRFAETNGTAEDIHTTDGQTVKVIRDGTSTIIREVQSLKTMVDEFSRFARLPNAKLQPGDLNELIRQAAAMYEGRSSEARLELDLAEGLPPTLLDAEQIKRVFVNLIENAYEAFDEQGGENLIRVTTRYEPARDIIVAELTDNGKGIQPADLQRLFQPYFSTKGRGTGLGLAIVQRIISEHGGKIIAGVNQPNGARFTIELPVG
ncbi:MAG TPA: ATP-binding protein [Pyrinomonadaceae bacterium]|nr:ATP-binding protein [Pyrinomonadaceae bacterium]HMP65601.1 ATP-binding protein [Pyrinomonadaceae bacterium]